MSRVRTLGRRRVELKVWRRTERGLQVEEESVVFSNIEVRVKRAGPSELGDLEVTMSRCHACGLRNSECHAPGRAKGLEENGAGPSGGGGGERCIFNHRGQGQARWAFRAWGSGGDGIYRAHTQRAVRERGRRTCPPGNDRSEIHA